jgi:hypothetical protein
VREYEERGRGVARKSRKKEQIHLALLRAAGSRRPGAVGGGGRNSFGNQSDKYHSDDAAPAFGPDINVGGGSSPAEVQRNRCTDTTALVRADVLVDTVASVAAAQSRRRRRSSDTGQRSARRAKSKKRKVSGRTAQVHPGGSGNENLLQSSEDEELGPGLEGFRSPPSTRPREESRVRGAPTTESDAAGVDVSRQTPDPTTAERRQITPARLSRQQRELAGLQSFYFDRCGHPPSAPSI